MKTQKRSIELLAPARNADIAIEAIKHGADAVYIGASSYGARSSATNSLDEIVRAVEYAHRFDCRVYCTVNTIVYDSELKAVESLIKELYRRDVDALIVQDMGILRMDIPPIALHASTQCDTRDAAKARFLEDVGFSQIVLARELTLNEIREISNCVTVPLEAFVHGALCVSYSGDCQASFVVNGRSSNRGECAQMCRLPYELLDENGRRIPVKRGAHLLSLKDMNRSQHVKDMIEAGISSFKIEGRLKDASYVKNVVGAYRRVIDGFIATAPDRYRRSSIGFSSMSFTPNLLKSFNRDYTDYFLVNREASGEMASIESPKSVGTEVGTVIEQRGLRFKIKQLAELHNGDGLGFYDQAGNFQGFRLNQIVGDWLSPASKIRLKSGTKLYRNSDKEWHDLMDSDTASRTININLTLRRSGESTVTLDATINESGLTVSSSIDAVIAVAKTPQKATRLSVMSKLGDTVYRLERLDDHLGDLFIPVSVLATLRRKVVYNLNHVLIINHRFFYRKAEMTEAVNPTGKTATYHDNIANSLSAEFYRSHGVNSIEPSIETSACANFHGRKVMTTRYCLRRELGCCLKSPNAGNLPRKLFIQNGKVKFQLIFDCLKCEMQVLTL